MADVFISYKSDRRAAAEHLAEILTDHGYTVWWDYGLVSGRDFARQIEAELHQANAVVVLWCSLSVNSDWVRQEALFAKNAGKIVPVRIEGIQLPFGFLFEHTLDLSAWDGSPKSGQLEPLLRQLERAVGRTPSPDKEQLDRTERLWRRLGAPSLAQFAVTDPVDSKNESTNLDIARENATPHRAGYWRLHPKVQAALTFIFLLQLGGAWLFVGISFWTAQGQSLRQATYLTISAFGMWDAYVDSDTWQLEVIRWGAIAVSIALIFAVFGKRLTRALKTSPLRWALFSLLFLTWLGAGVWYWLLSGQPLSQAVYLTVASIQMWDAYFDTDSMAPGVQMDPVLMFVGMVGPLLPVIAVTIGFWNSIMREVRLTFSDR